MTSATLVDNCWLMIEAHSLTHTLLRRSNWYGSTVVSNGASILSVDRWDICGVEVME